jgi:hypothetical protein
MSDPAEKKKGRKQRKYPVEPDIRSFPHKANERDGDGKIRYRDHSVGKHMHPKNVRSPEITVAVGHE